MNSTIIALGFSSRSKVLALGAYAKNRLCFLKGRSAYVGPLFNTLEDPGERLRFFKAANRFLKEKPQIGACDLHPDYPATRYIDQNQRYFKRCIRVQHHHAHIASCMAENGLGNEKVIGVAFDGTGLGPDHTFWGAEILVCDYKEYRRFAHLKEVLLAGGEQAIIEPWRAACFWLWSLYGERFLGLGIPFTRNINRDKWAVVKQMFSRRINVVQASSMGRLFDAAASIILARAKAGFEAELAIALEKAAAGCLPGKSAYSLKAEVKDGGYVYDPLPLFEGLVRDIKKKASVQEMAWRFHFSVAKMVGDACCRACRCTGIKKVVLSGGAFQNTILLTLCLGLLYKEDFTVLCHQKLSCSDAGISLGQAAIASFQEA